MILTLLLLMLQLLLLTVTPSVLAPDPLHHLTHKLDDTADHLRWLCGDLGRHLRDWGRDKATHLAWQAGDVGFHLQGGHHGGTGAERPGYPQNRSHGSQDSTGEQPSSEEEPQRKHIGNAGEHNKVKADRRSYEVGSGYDVPWQLPQGGYHTPWQLPKGGYHVSRPGHGYHGGLHPVEGSHREPPPASAYYPAYVPCRYFCPRPDYRRYARAHWYYCCLPGPATPAWQCPPPPARGCPPGHHLPQRVTALLTCVYDSQCPGRGDHCCYDVCLGRNVCKRLALAVPPT